MSAVGVYISCLIIRRWVSQKSFLFSRNKKRVALNCLKWTETRYVLCVYQMMKSTSFHHPHYLIKTITKLNQIVISLEFVSVSQFHPDERNYQLSSCLHIFDVFSVSERNQKSLSPIFGKILLISSASPSTWFSSIIWCKPLYSISCVRWMWRRNWEVGEWVSE